jgi:hypothetical protein
MNQKEAVKLYNRWIRLTDFQTGDIVVLGKRLVEQWTRLNALLQNRHVRNRDGMLISRNRIIYIPNLFEQAHDKLKHEIRELQYTIHLDLIDYIRCCYVIEYLQVLKMKQRSSYHFQTHHLSSLHSDLCAQITEEEWVKAYLRV